ncbi:hypothetical protein [Erythrobacter sp. A6_0]|uniref:hypothetical protein n=1 Tax=Erythrobacter sp. A6_0 TaxID=2821089 RepID=UPI001ADC38F1|nr:hypothetical protein [Erythrobacter sp. A6_0]MBO9510923.1 hypothetical protein [Erythrobacter sp. A6_0]
MGSIANLSATLDWDLDDFERGTRSVQAGFTSIIGAANRVADAVTAAGKKMTVGMTLPITGLGVLFTKVAADAAELQSAFDHTFGGMQGSMNAWAENTGDAMGRATSEMQQGALAFGQLFKGAAENEAAAARLSQRFTVLAQDAASFYNTDFDTAMGKIRSGLTGESEPLREFGVFLTEADVAAKGLELGLVRTGQELNEYGKIMARSALIAEGLRDAQGDVERTSDSLANRVRKIKGDFHELALEIGEILVPYAQKLAGVVEGVVEVFRGLPPWVKQVAVGFGVFLAAIGPVVVALSGLATLVLPLLLVRFMTMRGVIPPLLAILTAIVNPIGALVIGFGKLIGAATIFRGVAIAAGAAMRVMLGPLGLLITGVALLANNAQTSSERTDELTESNAELAAKLRAAGVQVDDFGNKSAGAAGGVNSLASSMDNANAAGKRLIQTLARVAEIKELKKELEWIDRAKERKKGVDLGGGYVQVETGGYLGYRVKKAKNYRPSAHQEAEIAELDARKEKVAARMRLLALANENNIDTDTPSGGTKDYAQAADIKPIKTPSAPKGPTGPSASELESERLRMAEQARADQARQDQEELRARIQLSKTVTERADLERDLLELERDDRNAQIKAEAEQAARMVAQDKDLSATERAARLAIIEEQRDAALASIERLYGATGELLADGTIIVRDGMKSLYAMQVEQDRAVQIAREQAELAEARFRASSESLQLEYDLAETDAERQEIALRILDAEDAFLRAKLNAVAANEALADAEREQARIALQSLEATADQRREVTRRRTETPVQRYLRELDRSPAQINEAMDRIKLDGLDALNDGLVDAMTGVKSLGDVFSNIADQIVADLLRIAVQRAIIGPLADALFPGAGASESSGRGGLLGGFASFLSAVTGKSASAPGAAGVGMPGWTPIAGARATALPRWNNGGGGIIKGYPGVDRNLLELNGAPLAMVSRGEQLSVTPAGGAPGGKLQVEVVAHSDGFAAMVRDQAGRVIAASAPHLVNAASSSALANMYRSSKRGMTPGGITG